MKLNKIAGLLKKHKCIYLLNGPERSQWAGDGGGLYPLLGLPYLEEENLYTIFSISEKQQEKLVFKHTRLPEEINFTDTDDEEALIKAGDVAIELKGRTFKTFQTSRGIVFVDSAYIAPFMDDPEYQYICFANAPFGVPISFGYDLAFYERMTAGGQIYIAAKTGLMLIGILLPYDLVTADFVGQMQALTLRCQKAFEQKQEKTAAQDAGQVRLEIEN